MKATISFFFRLLLRLRLRSRGKGRRRKFVPYTLQDYYQWPDRVEQNISD